MSPPTRRIPADRGPGFSAISRSGSSTHAEVTADQRRFAITEATRKLDAAATVLAADVLAGTVDLDTAVGVLDLIDRAAAHLRWAA